MTWWPVALLLVLAVALGWWLAGRGRALAASRSEFSVTTRPAATRPMTQVERRAAPEEDNGPETVLSYLHFQDNSAGSSDHPTGPPSDFGAHATAKNFIPFYMGSDKTRYQAVYKGQGRLLFASSAGPGNDKMHLIWIIHSVQEDGKR